MSENYSIDDIISYDNLLECAYKCCKGLLWKPSVQMFYINLNKNIAQLERRLKNNNFKSQVCTTFNLSTRGKIRYIETVSIRERVVQKCACDKILKPVLTPTLIRDNYATVKGRGVDDAIRRCKVFLQKHYRHHGIEGGVLTVDFHNYFGCISHNKLKEFLAKSIKDKELCEFCYQFVDMFDREYGISIGNESSQVFAIFYMNILDHYIKEELHVKYYGRYMDDLYIIHEDLNYLNFCLKEIRRISGELGITLNPKHTQIHPFKNQSFNFLKKRFSMTETGRIILRLEGASIQKRRQKMLWQREKLNQKYNPERRQAVEYDRNGKVVKYKFNYDKFGIESILQSYMSFNGYIKKFDCHRSKLSLDNLFYDLFSKELEEYILEKYKQKPRKFKKKAAFKQLYPLIRHKNPNAEIVKLVEGAKNK